MKDFDHLAQRVQRGEWSDVQSFIDDLSTYEVTFISRSIDRDNKPVKETVVEIATWFAEKEGAKKERKMTVQDKLAYAIRLHQALAAVHNVRKGRLTQQGRITLTDAKSATFDVTPKGEQHVRRQMRKDGK